MPSCTMVIASSGLIPTITVIAPRSRAMAAILRSVCELNESTTSIAATSMITPFARSRRIRSIRSCWKATSWSSSRAVCTEAMRYGPSLRIETRGGSGGAARLSPDILAPHDREAEQPLGLLDAALQVADRVHLAEVDADGHQRLRDL